jgi:hypothetical protein
MPREIKDDEQSIYHTNMDEKKNEGARKKGN